ncbi:MAG: nucleotidyltransferase domain-containing protein [Euryarchaeota archaeon]|nr:nucleotidyltransferase domain-containing protein [Euryarchaeota archaeon]
MKRPMGRAAVLKAVVGAMSPLKSALAAWEQGAASFGRVDEWSDIDLCVIAGDKGAEPIFRAVENALAKEYGIARKFRLPEPTWHGHSQCFYALKGASPFLFVDMAVMKRSRKDRFLEYSIHGPPKVLFDKLRLVRDDTPKVLDFAKKIEGRLQFLKNTFEMFQVEVMKELNRGNDIEALAFYNGMTLRPLVEALRIKHCPWRYNFHTRYVYYDLPKPIVKRLHGFAYVADAKALGRKRAEAEKWFWQVVNEIDMRDVKNLLSKTGYKRQK